jgi:undecaprenyl-phosphate 4-deoxy-4-formamido-L-arabinose transferase
MNSDAENLLVSIVIPVYNAEKTIGPLIDELVVKCTSLFRLEIILVNDASMDGSEKVCIGLTAKYPEVVALYTLAINSGEHNAVMAGLNHASGKFAVIMDDDFQNQVWEVIRLVRFMADSDFDVVFTCYKEKKHSLFRNFGSWFNDQVANLMLKKPHHLYLSSFKIINRFMIDEIIRYTLPFPYIDGLILRSTRNIGQLEVAHHPRQAGKSNYTLKKLISLWLNTFTNFSILPLRIATIFGFIFSLFGFAFGIATFIEKLSNPDIPAGYTSMIVILSVFAGIQMIAVGIVGEYLGRAFIAQTKKPQYIIRKSYKKGVPDGKR